jgi:hypothetical protein
MVILYYDYLLNNQESKKEMFNKEKTNFSKKITSAFPGVRSPHNLLISFRHTLANDGSNSILSP